MACSARSLALRSSLASAAVVTVVLGAGCIDIVGADLGRYVEREDKRFSVTGGPDVVLGTFDGSIEVRAWDKPEVQVTIEKRGRSKAATDSIVVRAEQQGNQITVDARIPDTRGFGVHFNASRSARLIVSAPAGSNIVAKSGDGSIDLEGIQGRMQLQSGDGSIHARKVSGDVDVHTGDGSVTLSGRLTGVRARSGDGSMNIHADAGSAPSADWDITTGDGSVTLAVPDGFGAELDAHTGDGGIHMQDLTLSNVTGAIARNSLRGRLGSGGHNVRVRTGDGSITLKRS